MTNIETIQTAPETLNIYVPRGGNFFPFRYEPEGSLIPVEWLDPSWNETPDGDDEEAIKKDAEKILARKIAEIEELHHFKWSQGLFALAITFDDVIFKRLDGEKPPIGAIVEAFRVFRWAPDVFKNACARRKNPYTVKPTANADGTVRFSLITCRDAKIGDFPEVASIVLERDEATFDFSMWAGDLPPIIHSMRRYGWIQPYGGALAETTIWRTTIEDWLLPNTEEANIW